MLRNYLNAALRNLVRNKFYAGLNILGLAVGFSTALLIALFVRDELSYDKFLPNSDAVYMITSKLAVPNQEPLHTYLIPEEVTPWLKLDFQSLDKIVRLQPARFGLRHGDIEVADQQVYFADPEFFSVIQLPALTGDLATALNEPDSVVLTLSTARKYFGKDAPIGEILEFDRTNSFKVAAVIKDLPSNTQFNTEVIASGRSQMSSITRKEKNPPTAGWSVGSYTYFTLKAGQSIAEIEKALPELVNKHRPASTSFVGPSPLNYQAMTALHLNSQTQGGAFYSLNPIGDMNALKTMAVVGLLILFIAGVNFVNLSTARASRRSIEVGMRKTVGADPGDLVIQFLGESLLYVFFGMILAMIVVGLTMSAFNGYLQRTIAFDFWADPMLLAGIVGTVFVVGVAAGAYPAFVLARFRPKTVLKSGTIQSSASSLLRSTLVVLQFAILIGLILMTFVVSRQTSYALSRGLRLDTDGVFVMARGCSEAMQDGVKALPGVAKIGCSGGQSLGQGRNASGITLKDGTQLTIDIAPVGYGFFDLYGIKATKGRGFDRDHADQPPTPPQPVPGQPPTPPAPFAMPLIVNETLARKIDPTDPLNVPGQFVRFGGGGPAALESEIVAVVPDFAVDATHIVVPPTVYFMMNQRQIENGGMLSVKLRPDADETTTLAAIDKVWKEVGPQRPVSRYAMKEFIANLNTDVIRQSHVFAGFAVIAVFIAALGLFGLSAFTAERRTKEIGVRKALGADRGPIVRLLVWQFTKPVLWANLIAWPVSYYVMDRWLTSFRYHVDIELVLFAAASAIALLIAWVTIAGYSYRVSGAKPATALRYE